MGKARNLIYATLATLGILVGKNLYAQTANPDTTSSEDIFVKEASYTVKKTNTPFSMEEFYANPEKVSEQFWEFDKEDQNLFLDLVPTYIISKRKQYANSKDVIEQEYTKKLETLEASKNKKINDLEKQVKNLQESNLNSKLAEKNLEVQELKRELKDCKTSK